jgi:hypothetical protein
VLDTLKKEDYNILVINALNGSFAIQARKKYPKARIICAEIFSYFKSHLQQLGFEVIDFSELTEDMTKRFNVLLGNPPFQSTKSNGERSDQASNLWSKFWVKSLDIADDNGIVALISPTTWISPSSELRGEWSRNGNTRLWDLFDQYDSYANVVDVKKHFDGVGSTFGYVIVDKSKNTGLRFSDGVSTKLGFRANGEFDKVESELDSVNNLDKHFTINQVNSPDIRVSFPLTRTLTDKSVEILTGESAPTTGSDKDGLYLYIHVNTQAEAELVKKRIIDCLDILNKHCKYSGFINIRTVKMIKF